MKPGIGKLSEYEISREGSDYQGLSANDHEFNLHFTTNVKKRKVLTFYKDSQSPAEKEVSIPELNKGAKECAHFTRENKFYTIFKNNKLHQLSIYEFNGSTGKNIGAFTIPEKTFKELYGRSFNYIPERGSVNLNLLVDTQISSNKIYWNGDSIVFAYHDEKEFHEKDKHMYVSLDLRKKTVSVRVISTGIKTSRVNDYLLGDKIFFVSMYHRYMGPFQYEDSLFLDILDAHSLQRIKRLEMSPETEISWKSTPFVSSLGDTLENEWKQEDRVKKIFSELVSNPLFVQAAKNSAGHYIVTLGVQVYYKPGHNGLQALGVPSSPMRGPQRYFKGCLSDTFEPTTCLDVITPQDKAIARRGMLEKKIISHGVYYTPYSDFLISCNSQNFYLMYIERATKTLMVEKF